jgi:hypothetical protein
MVVTNEEKRYTVQMQGTAKALSAEEFESYSDDHYEQLPFSRAYKDNPEQVHFLISPTFLRFSDCSVYPWVLTEYM